MLTVSRQRSKLFGREHTTRRRTLWCVDPPATPLATRWITLGAKHVRRPAYKVLDAKNPTRKISNCDEGHKVPGSILGVTIHQRRRRYLD